MKFKAHFLKYDKNFDILKLKILIKEKELILNLEIKISHHTIDLSV